MQNFSYISVSGKFQSPCTNCCLPSCSVARYKHYNSAVKRTARIASICLDQRSPFWFLLLLCLPYFLHPLSLKSNRAAMWLLTVNRIAYLDWLFMVYITTLALPQTSVFIQIWDKNCLKNWESPYNHAQSYTCSAQVFSWQLKIVKLGYPICR